MRRSGRRLRVLDIGCVECAPLRRCPRSHIQEVENWFRLTENRAEADIVLEITGRNFSSDKALVVYGRLTTANVENAEIVGQCIPGILDLKGPWKSAAENMAKRVETFCRETYADLAEAQGKRAKALSLASQ